MNSGISAVIEFKRNINSDHTKHLVDGHTETQLIEMACAFVPEGHSKWTIRLLEEVTEVILPPVNSWVIRNA